MSTGPIRQKIRGALHDNAWVKPAGGSQTVNKGDLKVYAFVTVLLSAESDMPS